MRRSSASFFELEEAHKLKQKGTLVNCYVMRIFIKRCTARRSGDNDRGVSGGVSYHPDSRSEKYISLEDTHSSKGLLASTISVSQARTMVVLQVFEELLQ